MMTFGDLGLCAYSTYMSLSEIISLAAVVLSIGTNVGLYVHLSSVMNSRFDSVDRKFENVDRKFESVERRLEMIQADIHGMDLRISKLES
jgi:hypothetical protein